MCESLECNIANAISLFSITKKKNSKYTKNIKLSIVFTTTSSTRASVQGSDGKFKTPADIYHYLTRNPRFINKLFFKLKLLTTKIIIIITWHRPSPTGLAKTDRCDGSARRRAGRAPPAVGHRRAPPPRRRTTTDESERPRRSRWRSTNSTRAAHTMTTLSRNLDRPAPLDRTGLCSDATHQDTRQATCHLRKTKKKDSHFLFIN